MGVFFLLCRFWRVDEAVSLLSLEGAAGGGGLGGGACSAFRGTTVIAFAGVSGSIQPA